MSVEKYSAINILILGKTGVGKSSLLNYLWGEAKAEIGHGKPTTGEGIYKKDPFNYKGLLITVYDSCGLEPDKVGKWKEIVDGEVRKRDTREIKDWFHTIIYCVDAQRGRIEDFEKTEILRPLIDGGNRLVFALTKSDIASENEKKEVSKILIDAYPGLLQVEVGSAPPVKLRSGRETRQFGRDELFEKICVNFSQNIIHKAVAIYKRDFKEGISLLTPKVLKYFDEQAGPLGIFTSYGQDFQDNIKNYAKKVAAKTWKKSFRGLKKKLEEGGKFFESASKSFTGLYSGKITDMVSLPGFKDWDNSARESIAEIFVNFFPPNLIKRKDMYKDKTKYFCERLAKKLIEKNREEADELENRLI